MNPRKEETDRFGRYERVVRAVVAEDEFSLQAVKSVCAEELPAFVTRVVRMLESDGHLELCETKGTPRYRWNGDRKEFDPSDWVTGKVYNNRITRAPMEDRPRERLMSGGAEGLRIADLLAILVRSGRQGESAMQAGEKIAARFADRLQELPEAGRGELKGISAVVADTAFCQIMAGIELGRRVEQVRRKYCDEDRSPIRSTVDAVRYCQSRFARLAEDGKKEEFWVVCLDTKLQVVCERPVSTGLLNQSLVGPREVFRVAIKENAMAVILVHNHPSGDPTPSREDLAVTERLEKVAQTIGIQMLDHVVVARQGALSIQEYRQNR